MDYYKVIVPDRGTSQSFPWQSVTITLVPQADQSNGFLSPRPPTTAIHVMLPNRAGPHLQAHQDFNSSSPRDNVNSTPHTKRWISRSLLGNVTWMAVTGSRGDKLSLIYNSFITYYLFYKNALLTTLGEYNERTLLLCPHPYELPVIHYGEGRTQGSLLSPFTLPGVF